MPQGDPSRRWRRPFGLPLGRTLPNHDSLRLSVTMLWAVFIDDRMKPETLLASKRDWRWPKDFTACGHTSICGSPMWLCPETSRPTCCLLQHAQASGKGCLCSCTGHWIGSSCCACHGPVQGRVTPCESSFVPKVGAYAMASDGVRMGPISTIRRCFGVDPRHPSVARHVLHPKTQRLMSC